jgi:ribokinase
MASGIVRAPGGKGLNQAVVAARAGARVRFCAPIGWEPEARLLHEALVREPFAQLRLIEAEQPTDLSTLIVATGGENIIVSTGDCAEAITPYISGAFVRPIREGDWLLVQGNLSEAATWAAVSRAKRVVFNTAPIRWVSRLMLEAATVVVANEGEAQAITGLADPAAAAQAMGGNLGIVTLGAAGCILAENGCVRRLPAPRVEAVDTTGAGDIFCGVLAAALAMGEAIEVAVNQAQTAAALSVSRPGCFIALPSATELQQINADTAP